MITYRKLDTIGRSGRHREVMSTAVAALALWHSMRECTT
jgi:hypothetical protein